MRVSKILIILGFILVQGVGPALSDPGPEWAAVVRGRVAAALASMGRTSARGRMEVAFTVTEAGDIVGVRVEGAPKAAAKATAALERLGKVPAPPDQRSHTIKVSVNVH